MVQVLQVYFTLSLSMGTSELLVGLQWNSIPSGWGGGGSSNTSSLFILSGNSVMDWHPIQGGVVMFLGSPY